MFRLAGLVCLVLACMCSVSAMRIDEKVDMNSMSQSPQIMPLWQQDVLTPAKASADGLVPLPAAQKPRWITSTPQSGISVYLPAKEKRTGAAVVIAPGGGYAGLAIDPEGHDVARWLASQGVAGIVLEYRLPNPAAHGSDWPLEDAQRAIRIVRSHALEWGVDLHRVGIMGFSAGGHIAACAGTHFDSGSPRAADPVERESCRPDFMVLVYPVITMTNDSVCHQGCKKHLLGDNPDPKLLNYYSAELQVTRKTPPAFIVQAKDDVVKVQNSILMADALSKAGVNCDLNLYDKGGHGFGLGIHGGEVASWPQRWLNWMKQQSFIAKGVSPIIAVK